MLLNTDLHVAEIPTHMSKTQFVRNTLQVIRGSGDGTPPVSVPSSSKTFVDALPSPTDTTEQRSGIQIGHSTLAVNSDTTGLDSSTSFLGRSQLSSSVGPSDRPSSSHGRIWDLEMENLLKVGAIFHI